MYATTFMLALRMLTFSFQWSHLLLLYLRGHSHTFAFVVIPTPFHAVVIKCILDISPFHRIIHSTQYGVVRLSWMKVCERHFTLLPFISILLTTALMIFQSIWWFDKISFKSPLYEHTCVQINSGRKRKQRKEIEWEDNDYPLST